MPSALKNTTDESLTHTVEAVGKVLNDEDVKHYGLQAEVLATALIYLKENPNATINEALGAGFIEWDL